MHLGSSHHLAAHRHRNSPNTGFEGEGLDPRLAGRDPHDTKLSAPRSVLHVEKVAGANLGSDTDQHSAAVAHTTGAHQFGEGLRHPVNSPDAYLKFKVEPRFFSAVHM